MYKYDLGQNYDKLVVVELCVFILSVTVYNERERE